MTRLDLQRTTEPGNEWAGFAAGVGNFNVPHVAMILILSTVVLAAGFNAAYGDQVWGMFTRAGMTDQYGGEHGKAKTYKHWREVIGELRWPSTGQADVSNRAGVRDTREVWLKSVRDRGTDVLIEGTSVSPAAVNEMISNLESTGYFSDIEIQETYRDDNKNKKQAFDFQLTCWVNTNKS